MLTSSALLLVLLSNPLVLPSLTGRTSGSEQFSLLNSALALQQPRCASRGLCRKAPGPQNHIHCPAKSSHTRNALCPTAPRNHAKAHFREPDLSSLRCNAKIAGQRNLQSYAKSIP